MPGACPLVASHLEGQSKEQKVRRTVQRRKGNRRVEAVVGRQRCLERLCRAEPAGRRSRSQGGIEGIHRTCCEFFFSEEKFACFLRLSSIMEYFYKVSIYESWFTFENYLQDYHSTD